MSNYDLLVVRRDQATADTQRDLIAETGHVMLAGLKLKDYVKSIVSGIKPAAVQTKANVAFASGSITFAGIADADTITVAGVVFTAKTSGATGPLQFNIGGSDTPAAVAAAAAINAQAVTSLIVVATGAVGVVTLTAYLPGYMGNAIQTAISAHGTVSGSGFLANGTNGDQERTHYYGSVGSTF